MDSPGSESSGYTSDSEVEEVYDELNPRPDLPPSIGAITLRKLIAINLHQAGFDSSSIEALEELEGIVTTFFEVITKQSHDLAELSHRNGVPSFRDILTSCNILGVGGTKELREEVLVEYDFREEKDFQIIYSKRTPSSPPPPVLSSTLTAPLSLPSPPPSLLAPYLPQLPPSHTYSQTPVYPSSLIPALILPPSVSETQQRVSEAALAHLGTLRLRLSDSRLVAGSLRGLVRGLKGVNSSNGNDKINKGKGTGATIEEEGAEENAIGKELVALTVDKDGIEILDDDIVDFESEWYGNIIGKGRKRTMGIIRVGANGGGSNGNGGKKEDEEDSQVVEEEKGIGGTGKRRKWRV